MNRRTVLLISGIIVAIIIVWQLAIGFSQAEESTAQNPITNISGKNHKQIIAQTGLKYVLSIISQHKN